jgi:hypothetical protein
VIATGARTFLVESYVPQLDESIARAISSRLRSVVPELRKEGVAVQWLGSFAVIDEETYLCIVAAADPEDVSRLNELAGLEHDHIVEVVSIDATPSASP